MEADDCTDCGKNNYRPEISGGQVARPREFPWMVRLFGGNKGCSGELYVGIFQDIWPKITSNCHNVNLITKHSHIVICYGITGKSKKDSGLIIFFCAHFYTIFR